MNWNRVLSVLVAAVYIVVALWGGSARAAFAICSFLILPLACIWFSEAMGRYIGPASHGGITGTTPGLVVCIVGWLLLLLPVIIEVVYVIVGSKP